MDVVPVVAYRHTFCKARKLKTSEDDATFAECVFLWILDRRFISISIGFAHSYGHSQSIYLCSPDLEWGVVTSSIITGRGRRALGCY